MLHRKFESHLDADSRDVIKLVMALFGTMSALVPGLLIASADSFCNAQKNELQALSANIVLVDRLLASYGVDTKKCATNCVVQ